ncbi:MAG: exo-alpha-sialidase [Candidatus Methylomirabilales bacterium]
MPHRQFIFDRHPEAPSCHAATVVEAAPGRLLAAWFAGTHEGHPDVAIWMSAREGGAWEKPIRIADDPSVSHFNPVLFRDARGTVWLFYKVGPSVPAWTGVYLRSADAGRTWTAPLALPAGLTGPAKNKPITLSNGDILCGASAETWRSWACWLEISTDGGARWSRHGPITAPGAGGYDAAGGQLVSAVWDDASATLLVPQNFPGVIQPAIWEYAPGRLKLLMRATRQVGYVCSATSEDYGRTWSPAAATAVPNPNSGLDAVRLRDGRIVLVCNPAAEGRTPLSVLVSEDNGETWGRRVDLETGEGEYSYPSVIQARDGRVHIVATWRRERICHYTLEPEELARP